MEKLVESPQFNFDDVDLDSIYIPDDFFELDSDLFSTLEHDSLNGLESPNSLSDLEKFLMDDVSDDASMRIEDIECFADLLADGSDSGKSSELGDVATPDSGAAEESEEKEKRSVEEEGDDDDRIEKKRRRQIRNRDSALKSRERKKMYIKDLETKSKFLESECRRLDYALQCCMAENLALHQSLQKGRPFGSHSARQESAVLVVESLLLGSLFWLVSIVCLFLLPSLPSPNLKDASALGRGLALEVVGSQKIINRIIGPDLGYEMVNMGRRCRGMRTRMKMHVVYA